MHIAIIASPDSQFTNETSLAVKRAGMVPVLNDPKQKLTTHDGYIILEEFSSEMLPFLKIQNELSKPILGISQGADMLIKSGLVPGIENDKPVISMIQKQEESTLIRLSENYQYNAFTRLLLPDNFLYPSSSKKRKLVIPSGLNLEMEENGLNVFRYCDIEGKVIQEEIAAVSNKAGNVMAILPALEYTIALEMIFSSMKEYILVGYKQRVKPLYYYPR